MAQRAVPNVRPKGTKSVVLPNLSFPFSSEQWLNQQVEAKLLMPRSVYRICSLHFGIVFGNKHVYYMDLSYLSKFTATCRSDLEIETWLFAKNNWQMNILPSLIN